MTYALSLILDLPNSHPPSSAVGGYYRTDVYVQVLALQVVSCLHEV